MESPRAGIGIVHRRSVPTGIVESRPVHDGAAVHVGRRITRRVADVHDVGCGVIDVNVLDVIVRVLRWDRIDQLTGDGRCDFERAVDHIRNEPSALVGTVVLPVDREHGAVGVNRVGHLGALDLLESR